MVIGSCVHSSSEHEAGLHIRVKPAFWTRTVSSPLMLHVTVQNLTADNLTISFGRTGNAEQLLVSHSRPTVKQVCRTVSFTLNIKNANETRPSFGVTYSVHITRASSCASWHAVAIPYHCPWRIYHLPVSMVCSWKDRTMQQLDPVRSRRTMSE